MFHPSFSSQSQAIVVNKTGELPSHQRETEREREEREFFVQVEITQIWFRD